MARYNTSLASATITGATTISSPIQGAFTALTGTGGYTVTLPAPVLFPGSNQTFYNATNGTVTISTPSGIFTGTGGSGLTTTSVFLGNVVSVTSDGTNYIVISEDGSILTATTASISGDVTINGGSAVVNITAGTVTLAPTNASNINNMAIGSTTRASGAFTTLAANNAVVFTANTASSSTTTGTLVVTGGIGATGNIFSGGSISATNLTGTLQTAAQPNITSTGSLTTTGLTVNGRQYFNGSASFYSLGSFNTGSSQWVLLGRFTGGGVGETLNLQFYGAQGYNGVFGQHSRTFIQIRTGNMNPVDTNISVDYHTEGQSTMVLDVRVQNVDGIAYGAVWDVYVQINNVCGNAYYIPFINSAASWSHTGTAGVGAPTVGPTVISGTNLFMMNSTSWFGNNVGIGTISPLAKLDITQPNNTEGDSALRVYANNRTQYTGLSFNSLTSTYYLRIQALSSNYIALETNGTERLRVNSGGDIVFGGGQSGVNRQFTINGAINKASRIIFQESGVDRWLIGHGAASENANFEIYSANGNNFIFTRAGNFTIPGTFTATSLVETSSITLKENVEPIVGALDLVNKLMGKIYDRRDNGTKQESGLIAEEVFATAPNLVALDEDGKPVGVKYTKIIAYLIESVKELSEEIRKLKGQ
jgi:hypothetical protein